MTNSGMNIAFGLGPHFGLGLFMPTATVDTVSQSHSITAMKNITLSVPDEVYRKARLAAAQRETSVSAMVAEILEELATGRPKHAGRAAAIGAAFDAVSGFKASDRLTRDQVHDRAFIRELDRRRQLLESASSR